MCAGRGMRHIRRQPGNIGGHGYRHSCSGCRWELTGEIAGKTMESEPGSVACRQGVAVRVAARGLLVFITPQLRGASERKSLAENAQNE